MNDDGAGPLKSLWTALRALVYTALFVWLWGWVALSLRPYDWRLGGALPAWAVPLGWVVIAAGAAVAASCISVFILRGQGTPAPFDAPRRVVAAGPYRIVRNPMYLGGFLILCGFGLVERSAAIVLFAIVWLLIVHLAVVFLEEPDLRRKFGASYEDYRRAVPRWLPRRTRLKDNSPGGGRPAPR
ncbi:MAG TPA: isoprenylcysteine carboxylmethyltransferase family protein [Thermoanaerobaculia bacterium]|nr:isoprenylcysteine carboxylmethyltransferase family protein [Thermoanaerobaculia bacterium]